METPFANDMIPVIWKAFKNLYPDKNCICYWDDRMTVSAKDGPFGYTDFCDTGEIVVSVSPGLSVYDAAEVFAHELAHVAVGPEAEHGEKWKEAFDRIGDEYERISMEIFPDTDYERGGKT